MQIIISKHLFLPDAPQSIQDQLIKTMTLLNPKWIENDRMGRWNRGVKKVLKFYRKTRNNGLTIPRGYIRQLINLCKSLDVPFEIVDQRRSFEPISFSFAGQLRPFQEQAVSILARKEFGTLCAPTGSGKTIMALDLIAKRQQPALIIVHTRDLALQWIKQIERFLSIPEKEIGLIGGGKNKISHLISVALVQTLYKYTSEASRQIGHLIVDECHRVPSNTFSKAINAFDSKYMLGLSATPWRRDRLSKLIFWHVGDMQHEINKSDLIESGDVLSAEVTFRETDFKPFHDPVTEYSKMMTELTTDDRRNRMIAQDVAHEVLTHNSICLVLTDRKKHCETLAFILKYKFNIDATILTGDIPINTRQDIIRKLNQGDIRVIVATGQLIGEGFDCQNLTTLFVASPIRFSGRVMQYLGRVLRPAPGKENARVFDYADIHVPPLNASAKARLRIYQGE